MLRLPEVPVGLYRTTEMGKLSENEKFIGRFGEMMIGMLPQDLAFTVFVPSQRAFERDLRLRVNDSLVGEKMNDTYAVVSRILGFSAVPRTLSSVTVPFGREISYDSISGFTLYISKDIDAEFEQSIWAYYSEEEEWVKTIHPSSIWIDFILSLYTSLVMDGRKIVKWLYTEQS